MKITERPFNRLIGLEVVSEGEFLVSLPADERYTNHLGTVHAAAMLAVAEAGAGEFLLRQFGDAEGLVPVVRRLDSKFRKPASGRVSARVPASVGTPEEIAGWPEELESRGRVLVTVPVEVVDGTGQLALTAEVAWFIARQPGEE